VHSSNRTYVNFRYNTVSGTYWMRPGCHSTTKKMTEQPCTKAIDLFNIFGAPVHPEVARSLNDLAALFGAGPQKQQPTPPVPASPSPAEGAVSQKRYIEDAAGGKIELVTKDFVGADRNGRWCFTCDLMFNPPASFGAGCRCPVPDLVPKCFQCKTCNKTRFRKHVAANKCKCDVPVY
jgi:hypothetical protein